MAKYLIPFFSAFAISLVFSALAIFIGKKINWLGRSSKRHIRGQGVSRLGGVAIAAAFALAIFIDKNLFISEELYGFLVAAAILLIVGVKDDIKEIFWKGQLFFQIAVSVFVFIIGIRIYYITNPLTGGILRLDSGFWVILSAVIVILWLVAVMNAINWADGIDGLSGGISFIASATIFFLSLRPEVYQPPIAIISAILAGTILGFLIFNFSPSRILAGTSGSMFMGFSLGILAIFSGTKIATALLTLAIPIIDSLWVMWERIKNKRSIFKADKNHLHHKLMELGWSERKIAFIYWAVTAIIAFVALNTRAIGKSFTLLITFALMALALFFINKKISKLKGEKNK